jgi:hypothetical protein
VSNLTGGDTTTLSVGAADIDEVESGVAESGSISNATHTQNGPLLTKVDTFAANSGTGNQSVNDVGFQPKAVLFWITDRTSAGSSAYARFGRGWAAYDGSGYTQGAAATAWDDEPAGGAGTNSSRARVVDTACITLINQGGTTLAEANIVSFDSADGGKFTINWTTAGGSRLVTYLALGGGALTNVKAGGFNYPATVGHSETSVGFQPDAVLFMGNESDNSLNTTSTRGGHGFGIGISSSDRHTDAHRWRDLNTTDASSSGLDENYCLVFADDSTTPSLALDLVSMDANGFTLTTDVGDGTETPAVIYLAMKGIDVDRGVLTQPTSTGNQSVTSLSFEPSALLFDGGDKATTNGFEAKAEMVAGVATGSSERASFWIGCDSEVSPYPSDTDLSTSAVIRSLTTGTPTLNAQADFVSMNSDGFTINWTTADSTQRKIGWIALGPAGVVTTTLGDGTDPGNSTVAPGSADQYLNEFTFVTSSGSDSVDTLTVTTANTAAIASMEIWDDTFTTQYFSTVSSPVGDDWNFSGGTAIPVTDSPASFRVRFTAKDHATLPNPIEYAVTGTVTSYTCTNAQAGTDTDSATITVDNDPPADASWGTITPGDQQVELNWTNPVSDFYKVLILRRAGSAVGDTPTEGTEYNVDDPIGSSTVRYVGSLETFTDTGWN